MKHKGIVDEMVEKGLIVRTEEALGNKKIINTESRKRATPPRPKFLNPTRRSSREVRSRKTSDGI